MRFEGLELKTVDRSKGAVRGRQAGLSTDFARSYMGIRAIIGVVGIVLPYSLIIIDWLLMTEGRQIRDSMSAYYHSPARDLFVGGLVVVGGFLISYMTGNARTWDYVLSTCAGIAVMVVAYFPTGRAGMRPGAPRCGDTHEVPAGCTQLQQAMGEVTVARIHGIAAGVFVVLLCGLCFVFALREFGYGKAAQKVAGEGRSVTRMWREMGRSKGRTLTWPQLLFKKAPRVTLYITCGMLIAFGAGWALLGKALPFFGYSLGRVYVGELIAFTAFAVSWLAVSWDLWRELTQAVLPGGSEASAKMSPVQTEAISADT